MRDNLARKIVHPTQEVATVVGITDRRIRVRSSLGEVEVRRAASCLIEPEMGNEVLVVHHERGSHVLAVLERDEQSPARIIADGDLEIASPVGHVSMSGRDGINLLTPGEVVIAAETATVTAKKGEMMIDALTFLGNRFTAQIERVKTVSQSVESIAERWVQRVDRAYRFIAQSESTRAGYIEIQARTAFHVKAETTLVNSQGLTKIDGSQIHVG